MTALIEGLAGDETALPDDIERKIIERTDGIPLFAEELTKAGLLMIRFLPVAS